LMQLRGLVRPVAIVFRPNDGQHFLHWLRSEQVGSELFKDNDGRVVYLIPS